MIQDIFQKCYHASIQSHYQTFVLDSASQCAIVCLGHDQCAGFDICRPDAYNNDHICRLRNASAVASCTIPHRLENKMDVGGCVAYRRVSTLFQSSNWVLSLFYNDLTAINVSY
jgi:hypothetical protein